MTAELNERAEQLLVAWFAAGYSDGEIIRRAAEQDIQGLDVAVLNRYRQELAAQIEAAGRERRSRAANTGLALSEERLARLAEHAEEMEAQCRGKDGLNYAKEWRATLADIAAETGGRKPKPKNVPSQLKIYQGFDPEKV